MIRIPLGEMELSEKQSSLFLVKFLDLAIEQSLITEAKERDAIWEDNVLQWLYGEDKLGKQTLIDKILN